MANEFVSVLDAAFGKSNTSEKVNSTAQTSDSGFVSVLDRAFEGKKVQRKTAPAPATPAVSAPTNNFADIYDNDARKAERNQTERARQRYNIITNQYEELKAEANKAKDIVAEKKSEVDRLASLLGSDTDRNSTEFKAYEKALAEYNEAKSAKKAADKEADVVGAKRSRAYLEGAVVPTLDNVSAEILDSLDIVSGEKPYNAETVAAARKVIDESGYSKDELKRLAEYRKRQRDYENATQRAKKTREWVNQGAGAKIAGSAASVPANLVGGVMALAEYANALGYVDKDAPLNIYSDAFAATRGAQNIRQTVMDSKKMGDKLDFVYQTGMSALDSLGAAFVPGGAALLGASAAASTAIEMTERGASAGEATAAGVAAGVFEGLFEKVSIGNLKAVVNAGKSAGKNTAKQFAVNTVKAMGVNASEEAATEIANIAYDYLANGGISNVETMMRGFTAQGMSEQEAKRATAKELAKQIGLAGLSGALMGFGFGAGGTFAGNLMSRTAAETTQDTATPTPNAVDERSNAEPSEIIPEAENAAEGEISRPKQRYQSELLNATLTEARDRGAVSNTMATTIANNAPALAELGIDRNGKTAGQLRAEIKAAIMAEATANEVAAEAAPQAQAQNFTQAVVNSVAPNASTPESSTPTVVENEGNFDNTTGALYNRNINNTMTEVQNGERRTELDNPLGAGVRERRGVVNGGDNALGRNDGRADISDTSKFLLSDGSTVAPTEDAAAYSRSTFGKEGYGDAEAYRDGVIASEAQATNEAMGAADVGFSVPRGAEGEERISKQATGSMAYDESVGEASAMTKEEWDELFRYRTVPEAQSLAEAERTVYYEIRNDETGEVERQFIGDANPEAYEALKESLDAAPAWNSIMTDTAQLILRELGMRSEAFEITSEEYVEWAKVIKEHVTETARGTQSNAKWARDNPGGAVSELDAYDVLEQSSLTPEERRERFNLIVKFDRRIERAQMSGDTEAVKDVILEIARERGTLTGIAGKQNAVLEKMARYALDGMDSAELFQFAYSSSGALASDAVPVDLGQKIKTIQILNMLSNPKTPAKNVLGNTSFYAIDAMALRGAALLDMAVSKITGTRSMAFEKFALNQTGREAIAKAIRLSLAEITMDVNMGEGDRYQMTRMEQGSRQNFKHGGGGVFNTGKAVDKFAERVLSAFERNMGFLMTTSDEAYKGAARSTAAATQKLIDEGKIINAPADYAEAQADALALKRTFQNSGKVATAIQTLHDILNIVGFGDSGRTLGKGEKAIRVHSFGLGDLVAPFTRVAGNLAVVGADYSPIGAIKGTAEIITSIYNAKRKGKVDPSKQAQGVSDLARGLTGTAIAYGVMILAKAGIIRRADDEGDEDIAALNKSEGMMGTQVNVTAMNRWINGGDQKWERGDTLLDLSSIEPLNYIITLGVALADNEDDGMITTVGEPFVDTGKALVQAAGDLPILSNIGEFAKDVMVYHNNPAEAAAEMLGKTAISSVTPNIVAMFAKGLDDKQRNLYSGDGVADVLLDTLINRIPGARETLPTSVNSVGEEKENPGGLVRRLTNAMLNPVGVNEYTQSEVSQELERVREETGKTDFYPTNRKTSKLEYTDSKGVKHSVELTSEEKEQFQAVRGATQMNVTAELLGSSAYKSANTEMQAALLNRAHDYAYQYAKASVLGNDAADSWVINSQNARRDFGISQSDFFVYYEKYGGKLFANGDVYNKTKRMVDAGLTIEQWANMKQGMDANDNDSISKEEAMTYIESHFPKSRWSAIITAYNSTWKNPYE